MERKSLSDLVSKGNRLSIVLEDLLSHEESIYQMLNLDNVNLHVNESEGSHHYSLMIGSIVVSIIL